MQWRMDISLSVERNAPAWPQIRAVIQNQRWMRAEPPLAKAFTCSSVAMVVSPGNVVSSAPCAQPRLTASCSDRAGQQAVEEAGREAVAAADAVDAHPVRTSARR